MVNLAVKLTPSASSDRIDGWDVDVEGRAVLKVRVRARVSQERASANVRRVSRLYLVHLCPRSR